jgi:LmbE family N-acetylglucosaminyl deacetylase
VAASLARAYTPRAELTHRVDVRRHAAAKRAALRAHASQASGGAGDPSGGRTVAALLRLPGPLVRMALGREWFTEVGRPPGGPLLDDVLASLR